MAMKTTTQIFHSCAEKCQVNGQLNSRIRQVRALVENLNRAQPRSHGPAVTTQTVSNIGDSLIQRELVQGLTSTQTSPGRNLSFDDDDCDEHITKRQKLEENTNSTPNPLRLSEVKALIECRRRTFSHWGEKFSEFIEILIDAGFFGCNVGDRVMCIYCDTIYQQWDVETDDPRELHRLVSPQCPYIPLMSSSTDVHRETTTNMDTNHTEPYFTAYLGQDARQGTFEAKKEIPSAKIKALVASGFFYLPTENRVKCFHCKTSLNDWEFVDNPLVSHVRLSPQCSFAKRVCGEDLYQSIIANVQPRSSTRISTFRSSCAERTIDESLLSRLVAARLDLPVSQDLLNKNTRLSIIKRVWEDQLRIKHDDFVSDIDVHMACQILDKQIKIINGNKDNIIIPKKKKEQILRENEEASRETRITSATTSEPIAKTETVVKNEQSEIPTKEEKEEVVKACDNPCLVCKKAEKQLACIPCGHLATCLSCSQNIRTCPTCRRSIEAYVRIYL